MSSLINKQLLLTAYAYLFIMEHQKVHQGGEALQMNCLFSRGTGKPSPMANLQFCSAKIRNPHYCIADVVVGVGTLPSDVRSNSWCPDWAVPVPVAREDIAGVVGTYDKKVETSAMPVDDKTLWEGRNKADGRQRESSPFILVKLEKGGAKDFTVDLPETERQLPKHVLCRTAAQQQKLTPTPKKEQKQQGSPEAQPPKALPPLPNRGSISGAGLLTPRATKHFYAQEVPQGPPTPQKPTQSVEVAVDGEEARQQQADPDMDFYLVKIDALGTGKIPAMFILKENEQDEKEQLHNDNVRHNRRVLCRLLLASSSAGSNGEELAVCKAAAKLEELLKIKVPVSLSAEQKKFLGASREISIFDRETDMLLQKSFVEDGHSSEVVNWSIIAAGEQRFRVSSSDPWSPGRQLLHQLGDLPGPDANRLTAIYKKFTSSYHGIWPQISKKETTEYGTVAAAVFAASVFYVWKLDISPAAENDIEIPALIWIAMKQFMYLPVKSHELHESAGLGKVPENDDAKKEAAQKKFCESEAELFPNLLELNLILAAELSGFGGDGKLQVAMLKVIAHLADLQREGQNTIGGMDFSQLLRKVLIHIAAVYLPVSV